MAIEVKPPFPLFVDVDGQPLDGGFIYIGIANLEPITNPVSVFWDDAMAVPALQPIRTIGGMPSRSGSPSAIFSGVDYSMTVKDVKGRVVYTDPSATKTDTVMLSYLAPVPGAVATDQYQVNRRSVSIHDFMSQAEIDDTRAGAQVLDLSTSLAKGETYLRATATPSRLVFPAGRYRYSVSPNWGIKDVEIIADGEVRLAYIGTGDAVILNADPDDTGVVCYQTRMSKFIVEGGATTQNGVLAKGICHGKLGFSVRGAGATYSGFKPVFCICSEFDIQVSGNEVQIDTGGWQSQAPANGIFVDRQGLAGNYTSYCTFINPVCEGMQIGIYLNYSLGNTFVGGTAEGCSVYGVLVNTPSNNDKFIGMDFEANTLADVLCSGIGTQFKNCDSDTLFSFGPAANRCTLDGGVYKNITLNVGSTANTVHDLTYNRFGNGGLIIDDGLSNLIKNVVDCGNPVNTANAYHEWDIDRYVKFEDDFLGFGFVPAWHTIKGSNGTTLVATAQSQVGGVAYMVMGNDAGGTMALNGVQMDLSAQWRTLEGGLEAEFRVNIDVANNAVMFFGFSNTPIGTLRCPVTYTGTTLTANDTEVCGVLFDSTATAPNWKLVGVAAGVPAAVQDSGFGPAASVYETWRIRLAIDGSATFFRNGTFVGATMAGALTPTALVTPIMAVFSRGAVNRTVLVDYVSVKKQR